MSKVLKRVTFIALIVVALSAVLLCGTLAKYISTLEGSVVGTVAKWKITANGNTESIQDISLGANKLQPGTSGTFNIELKNEGDVSATYTVTLTASEGAPTGLTFNATSGSLTGTLENGKSTTITVTWSWPYDGNDESDTSVGEAATGSAQDIVDISVTATQVKPAS